MENGIVIIDLEDIPFAAQLAAQLPSYKIFVFDPVLVDKLHLHKLRNIQLLTWINCPPYSELESWAHTVAYDMENEIGLAVKSILPTVSLDSWQHLNLFYLLVKLRWYSGLWDALASQMFETKIHLFLCEKSSEYHSNSYIPALLLIQRLKKSDVEFFGFTYGVELSDVALVPNLRGGLKEEGAVIVTHLPTCFYDIYHINSEMQATNNVFVNLRSRHYDMPTHAHLNVDLIDRVEIIQNYSESTQRQLCEFQCAIKDKLNQLLEKYIAIPVYRARQCEIISSIYLSQLVAFYLLDGYFAEVRPSKIIISDRSMGFHGPIISYATKYNLPVLMLPHSKTLNDIEFRYKNIVALTHPIQGLNPRNANGVMVLSCPIIYPQNWSGSNGYPRPIKKIALLLNALTLNGVYYSPFEGYIDGIKEIVAWCVRNGIEVAIRCKPSYSIIMLLSDIEGIDVASLQRSASISMSEYLKECDLCVMFDSPTSAAVDFLNNSIPILNATQRPLSTAERTFINSGVVPRESVERTLDVLDGFLSDLNSFLMFRNEQFRNYMNLGWNARPLRAYL
jgi:hypothetical protein